MMVHVTYRPKPASEEQLFALVKQHWPVLRRLGLSTGEPAEVYRATDKRTGRVSFIEIFSWKDDGSSAAAHNNPEVMAIWDAMGPLLESLDLQAIEKCA